MLRWQSRWIFGPADALETWDAELPVGLWQHSVPTLGTTRKTGTGVPGATFKQRQHLLVVPVRFTENEWPTVRRLIEWGQTKAPFIWLPDRDPLAQDQAGELSVILAAPRVADAITPEPDNQYLRVSVVRLTLRQIVTGGES